MTAGWQNAEGRARGWISKDVEQDLWCSPIIINLDVLHAQVLCLVRDCAAALLPNSM